MRIPALLVIFLLLLAGCQTSQELEPEVEEDLEKDVVLEPRPEPGARCVKELCLPEPDDPNARVAWERHRLVQIFEHTEHVFSGWKLDRDGDFIVYNHYRTDKNNTPMDNLVAFNLTTQELVPIVWEDYYPASPATVKDGQVFFGQAAWPGAPDHGESDYGYLVEWNNSSRNRTKVPLPLDQSLGGFDFDGHWLLISHASKNDTQRGLWVLNIEDGELRRVFHYPHELPNEQDIHLNGAVITEGVVYYGLNGDEVGHRFFELHEYTLANDTDRVVFESYGDYTRSLQAEGPYVVWWNHWAGPEYARMYNRETGEVVDLTPWNQSGKTLWPVLSGEWLTYEWSTWNKGDILRTLHIPTMKVYDLFDEEGDFLTKGGACNDSGCVLEMATRNLNNFQYHTRTLFWMPWENGVPPT